MLPQPTVLQQTQRPAFIPINDSYKLLRRGKPKPVAISRSLHITTMSTKLGYQRLRKVQGGYDYDGEEIRGRRVNIVTPPSISWSRFRSLRRVSRRFIRIKIPSLRRFRFLTKKVSVVRVSCAKVMRRLKESQAHFGDLFAGNYIVVQINPSSLKSCIKNYEICHSSLPARVALPL